MECAEYYYFLSLSQHVMPLRQNAFERLFCAGPFDMMGVPRLSHFNAWICINSWASAFRTWNAWQIENVLGIRIDQQPA